MSDTHNQAITPTGAAHDTHGVPGGAHSGHAPTWQISEAELHELHKSDIGAGGAVVVLMSAIFTIGLLLYTVIAIVVAR